MACQFCNKNHDLCTCKTVVQPYCDQCSEDNSCAQIFDADCVFYHPTPDPRLTKLTTLGLPNNSSASSIFEAIDGFLGRNGATVPLTVIDSPSINLTASGLASHTLEASIIISPDSGNTLQVRSNGLYTSSNDAGKVKIKANDPSDYLINQLIGGTDGCVTTTIIEAAGMLQIQPQMDINCLVSKLLTNQTFIDAICQIMQNCMGKCATIGSITTEVQTV